MHNQELHSHKPGDAVVTNSHLFPSIDQLDIRLIEEFESDARQTYKDLAAKLGVSNPTITGRVKRLVDGGVIRTICWADPISLGYKFRVIFAIYTLPGYGSDVADRLAANTRISAVHLCTGRFNVMAWALFRTGEDLSDFLSNELKPIPGVLHVETILTLQEVKVSLSLVATDKETRNPENSEKDLDDLDLKLIRELQTDARQKAGQLARKLGVYQSTVFRRMQKLMDEHVIRIGIYTHPFALGYEGVATIGLKCDPGKVRDVAEAVASYKQVQYVGICAGRYDIATWVVFRKLNDLRHFVTVELGSIPGLKDIDTIVNFKLVKMLFQIPINS